MASWSIDAPRELTFDEVTALTARIAGGAIDVVATTGRPRLEVSAIEGGPLLVEHESGRLTVRHEKDGVSGLLDWPRPFEHRRIAVSLAVPAGCPVDIGAASAATVVSGIEADTAVRGASGPVTLDSLTGHIVAKTASGDVEARGLAGKLDVTTASGEVTIASGSSERLRVKSVSGRLSADIDLVQQGSAEVASVSGDVAVRLPATIDVTVDLRSVSGQVGAAFDGLRRRRHPGRVTAHGRIGRGSGRLTANTVSGDIALLRRPIAGRSEESA